MVSVLRVTMCVLKTVHLIVFIIITISNDNNIYSFKILISI
jgi:hypothetical protein